MTKDIKAIRGRHYISELIAQGEHEHQDFKFAINDARKIARSLSAFANNGGGHLLIGVKDNGVVAGVRNEEDIYVIEQAAQMYCRPPQHVEFTAFSVDAGVVVIRARIEAAHTRPVMVDEGRGQYKAYFRVADENIVAHPLMVRAWRLCANKNREAALIFGSNDLSTRILQTLAQGALALEKLMVRVHASRRNVEDAVVTLVSMGLVRFQFNGTSFILAATD